MKGRVLIVQFDAHMTGSAFSGLLLANGLRENGWDTCVAFGHEGPMVERYESASHQVMVLPHKNWIRTNRFFHFIKVISKELKASNSFKTLLSEVNPDVVYINTSVSFAAARAAHKLGYPIIWHLRELFSNVGGEMKVPFGFKPIIRSVFRAYARQLVAISDAVAMNMLGSAAREARIIPNAVGSSFFDESRDTVQARAVLQLPDNRRIIGVPGTLRPMKGHSFFFRSIAPLVKADSNLVIAVTGGGEVEYVQQLKNLVRSLGLQSNVYFLDYVVDMPAFYRACDVVCIPSVAEPFGRTVIEAFAVGVPVVATAVGGINEIVDHEENGLLIPYGDEKAMATAIANILEDEALGERLSNGAIHKARTCFHESTYKSQISQVVSDASGMPRSLESPVIS